VAQCYGHEYEERRDRVEVYIQTASPMTDPLREQIKEVAVKQTGRQAKLVETVDESLIGGLVMRIGDLKFDASIATRLRRLGQALQDRASHELLSGRKHWEGSAI
ncbi:MAG: F0F1 ATP synthase subunit delta, partial [Planctomycetes bacterium]|nr:F0F1 ATP synthase subunit delta [Planctomycetota bacterium]